jgi:hypothetical protein
VLGGAFVLGMAVARFLKASRPSGAAYGTYRYDDGGYTAREAYDEPTGYRYDETVERQAELHGGFVSRGDVGGGEPSGLTAGGPLASGGPLATTGLSDAAALSAGTAVSPTAGGSASTPGSTPSVTTTATGTWSASAGQAGGSQPTHPTTPQADRPEVM